MAMSLTFCRIPKFTLCRSLSPVRVKNVIDVDSGGARFWLDWAAAQAQAILDISSHLQAIQ